MPSQAPARQLRGRGRAWGEPAGTEAAPRGGGGAGSLPGQPSWARPRGRPTPGTKPRRGKRLDAGGRGVPAGCSLPAAPIATAARESRAFLCALTAGEKPRSSSAWGHMALNCPIWERQRRVAGRFGCKKGTRCLSRHIHQLSRGIYPDGPAGNPMQPRESLSAGSRASDGSRTGSSAPPPPLQPRSPGPARPGPGRRGTHPRRGQTRPGAPPPGPSAPGHVLPKATGRGFTPGDSFILRFLF